MLPTKGYFKDIDCPYHERSCGRPYCHFRHRKKTQQENEDTSPSKTAIPTYKPTPKSELASNKSHIPISYVPDVVRSSTRSSFNIKDRPTYKPTPKSVLSNQVSNNAISTGEKKGKEIITTYTPTPIIQLQDGAHQQAEFDFDELAQEFQMIDEILVDSSISDEDTSINKKVDVTDKKHKDKEGDTEQSKDSKTRGEKMKEGKDRANKKSDTTSKSKTHKTDRDRDRDKDKRDRNKSSSSKEHDSKNKSSRSKDRKDKQSRSSCSSTSTKSSSSKSHKDKIKDKDRDKNKEKHIKSHTNSNSDSNKNEKEDNKVPDKDKNRDVEFEPDDYDVDVDIDFHDDPDIDSMMIEDECFKIFNEYKSPEEVPLLPQSKPNEPEVQEAGAGVQDYTTGKKRIAYSNAAAAKEESKPHVAVKHIQAAGSVLQNRIRKARQAHDANEGHNIMQAMKNIKRSASVAVPPVVGEVKRPKPNGLRRTLPPLRPAPPSTSLIDDILSGRSSTPTTKPIRRIAPVSNVASIQMAKARIDEIKNRASAHAARTAAQTIGKGAMRAAHVPDASLSNLPDVLQADKSKLPVNVRTKYLCLLADECVKLYVTTDDAHARALNEEFKCYERCAALVTYRNSAMLAVNRLRKEIQVREASGLGAVQVGEALNLKADSWLDGKRFYDLVKGFILSEEELVVHGFPRQGPMRGRAVINNEHKHTVSSECLEKNQRICCRCNNLYLINRDGFPLFEEECCYHPLRKRTIRGERTYLCCKSTEDTGCVISNTHVSEISVDREFEGFQSTFESEREDDPRNYAVYALDCEMCYTTKGLELTRVTVVDSKSKIVYESFVKPFNPIIDYNTRFSGITQEHMDKTTTTILQIQATILNLCTAQTILIGHSLESDMKALKIIHNTIVDTSVMFPHKFGLPHKRALRALASEYLKKIIQNDVAGHDSAEDALAAMELVVWKVKDELKIKGIKH